MREFTTEEILGMDLDKLRDYQTRNKSNIEKWEEQLETVSDPKLAVLLVGEINKAKEHNKRLRGYVDVHEAHNS